MRARFSASCIGIALTFMLLLALGGCEREDMLQPPEPPAQRLIVPGPAFTGFTTGEVSSCALVADGTLRCWGLSQAGQAPAQRSSSNGLPYTRVSSGWSHACALRSDGVVECWGTNQDGQAPATRSAQAGHHFVDVGLGAYHSCAIREDGALECWGENGDGEAPAYRSAPGGRRYTQVSGGYYHSCALRDDGVGECWGYLHGNAWASPVFSTAGGYAQIDAGDYNLCALRNSGIVDCWDGQGTHTAPDGLTFTAVSASYYHTCALRSDGAAECWGGNTSGQAPPVKASADGVAFTGIGSGKEFTCALRADGTFECWGSSAYGWLSPPGPQVGHVLPEGTFTATGPVEEGASFSLSFADPLVPDHPEATTFTFAFDCGSGYGAFSAASSTSCAAADGNTTRTVKGKVKDQDSDLREYTATVEITNVAPTITAFDVPASAVLVGGTVTVTVTLAYSDPAGAADAPYVISIDCDNGTILAAPGNCTYTGPGSYTVAARVQDKDGAAAEDTRELVVQQVVPTLTFDLSSLPAKKFGDPGFSVASYAATNSTGPITFETAAGSQGCTVDPAGDVIISAAATTGDGCSITASVAAHGGFTAAVPVTQSFQIARAAGAVSITNIPSDAVHGGTFTPTYDKLGDGVASTESSTTAVCTVDAGVVHFETAGTCTLVPSVAEGTNHLAATGAGQSLTVGPAPTFVNLRPRYMTLQYSDVEPFMMASVGFYDNGRSNLAADATGTVQFQIGGEAVGSPQPVVNALATLAGAAVLVEPGSRLLSGVFTSTHPDYLSSSLADPYPRSLTVNPEDARVTYTGPEFATTPSATATSAAVPLSATIQDISAVPSDAAYDTYPGDIRNARVAFVNRDNGQVLCSGLIPVLVDPTDQRTGTVGCTATLAAGMTSAASYTIGIVVTGYYTRNASADNAALTVAQPISGMITGGGHLVNRGSAGQYAGGEGLKTNFGFNVKYNKNLTNLQGGVNIIVRGEDGKVYQIKSNALSSLVVNRPTKGYATAVSKANLTDITDPALPVSLGGNLELLLTMFDGGTPGTLDGLAITLRNNAGTLLFSSSWSGAATSQQPLHGGNLVVR